MEKSVFKPVDLMRLIGAKNFVTSVAFGMGADGVSKLIDDLKRLSTADMLSVIRMQRRLPKEDFNKAVDLFLDSANSLLGEKTENQVKLVQAIGFVRLLKLFDGEGSDDAVKAIFNAMSREKQEARMVPGLFSYFGEEKRAGTWSYSPEIMEFLSELLFFEGEYSRECVNKKLFEYLVDTYGLQIAYFRCKNFDYLASLLECASSEGIRRFVKTDGVSVLDIETELFLQNSKVLEKVVRAAGCVDAQIESYLLYTRRLPVESVRKNFCFPQNFSVLMRDFGAEQVAELFPESFKEKYPRLWNWVQTDRSPEEIDRYKCSAFEWNYLLADEKLCTRYILRGGELGEKDIKTLMNYGRNSLIATYFNRK